MFRDECQGHAKAKLPWQLQAKPIKESRTASEFSTAQNLLPTSVAVLQISIQTPLKCTSIQRKQDFIWQPSEPSAASHRNPKHPNLLY